MTLIKNTLDTRFMHMVLKFPCFIRKAQFMRTNAKLFDIIVLAGMVVNILLAVFLILYYFDFL